MKYGIFLGYTLTPAWLAKSREERERFRQEHLAPLFEKYADRLSVRQYDAEAFSASPTDFAFIETEDLRAYYFFIEELRDTPLFGEGLARIDVIHTGVADGYRHFAEENRESDDSH